jgi:predicted Zn-dependent protease
MSGITTQDLERYTAGRISLQALLGLGEHELEPLRGRAQFYIDGGHHERALIILEMLEALDEADDLVKLHLAAVLLALGRSQEAQERVEAILARHPDHADAKVSLAEIRLAAGDLVGAAALVQDVVARDPDGGTAAARRARGVALRGDALFRAGQ